MTSEKAEALLDGIFEIIAAEGFADLKMSDLARRLGCSPNTLYKFARTKESLLTLVIRRWTDGVLASALERAEKLDSPAARARAYYQAITTDMDRVSPQLRKDITHFDSTAMVWVNGSDKFVTQFADYLAQAIAAGEARSMHPRFLALMLRQIAAEARDEETVLQCGLTKEQAYREIDTLIWEGITPR